MSEKAPSYWQRQREDYAARLRQIEQQVKAGELVVRPMTEAEREKWGPAPDPQAAAERRAKKLARDRAEAVRAEGFAAGALSKHEEAR